MIQLEDEEPVTPERWKQVKTILAAAIERPADEQGAYLDGACGSDVALRREVESLIAAEAGPLGLDEVPRAAPRFTPGARLGQYEIVAALGAGGMGEVYRARDNELGREVALKLLPKALALDPDALARLRREALMLAALNHANIAVIHGIEETGDDTALVLELVEGETLAALIERGPVPVKQALALAREIVLGLEAAHDQGIIHRDLKPDNIKLTPDGRLKILDFGLAKAYEGKARAPGAADSRLTTAGMILGTAAYIPPEQARGLAVDRRVDVWAFGVVLWEMLTGHQPFRGDTTTDTLAQVLHKELDWSSLPQETPASVRRLLKRCIERDLKNRLHDIADARLELDEALDPAPEAPVPTAKPRPRYGAFTALLAALLAALVATVLVVRAGRRGSDSTSGALRHLMIADAGFIPGYLAAISADGRHIAYSRVSRSLTTQPLFVRALDSSLAQEIPGTHGAANPFFSPDGEWLAYFQGRHLWRVQVCDGVQRRNCAPQKICDIADSNPTGAWAADGTIVLSGAAIEQRPWSGLARVRATGGVPVAVTRVDQGAGERVHSGPEILPDGRTVLFTVTTRRGFRVDSVGLDGNDRHPVLEDAAAPRVAHGQLLFYRAAIHSVLAVPFDPRGGIAGSTPVTVAANVMRGLRGGEAGYAVSREGTLVYSDRSIEAILWDNEVVWVGRDGQITPLLDQAAAWAQPRLSPDGKQLLLRKAGIPNCDIWLYDMERRMLTRLTTQGDNHDPTWLPEGKGFLISAADEKPVYSIYERTTDGVVATAPLLTGPGDRSWPSWSRDGRRVAYMVSDDANGPDIWVRSDDGAKVFLATEFDEGSPAFSPDGAWIAYASDESGRSEVYVRDYPSGEHKVQISSGGGMNPLWSRNGRELFFENDRHMMVAAVAADTELRVEAARPLFEGSFKWERRRNFDVGADASRFVMLRPVGVPRQELHVVLNWLGGAQRSARGRAN